MKCEYCDFDIPEECLKEFDACLFALTPNSLCPMCVKEILEKLSKL